MAVSVAQCVAQYSTMCIPEYLSATCISEGIVRYFLQLLHHIVSLSLAFRVLGHVKPAVFYLVPAQLEIINIPIKVSESM